MQRARKACTAHPNPSPPFRERGAQRRAFTLVELLVAMALTLFLMVILSEAFSAGLGAFRQLKSVCDLQEKLRTAASIIRRDLRANYYKFTAPATATLFTPGSSQDNVRLSFFNFADTTNYQPPTEGFLRLWQEGALTNEGVDGDGLACFRMSATDNLLHFSIKLEKDGKYRPESYLSVPVPLGSPAGSSGPVDLQSGNKDLLNSQIAEVVYFLGPNSTGTTSTTKSGAFGGVPLFALYRRQLVAPNSAADANTLNGAPRTPYTASSKPPEDNIYYEVSCKQDPQVAGPPQQLYFNTPADLTIPERRFGMVSSPAVAGQTSPPYFCAGKPIVTGPNSYPRLADQLGSTAVQAGDDIVLANVVSFVVKILAPAKSSDFIDLFDSTISSDATLNVNAAINSYSARVFDTWSYQTSGSPTYYDYSGWNTPAGATYNQVRMPMPIKVIALQIILRVWDEKSERTRQITIVQDM
jgi:prepilin-type N-terminal cleavage/methylation domain-containing protein